ncbi:MAG TPA: glycosyl hydrolase family 28-related protein, partial [Armatimonadota bacterium]
MRPTRCNEGVLWDEPRWHREHYKVVTDFGAVGDGLADDTDAIQAAIDYHAGSRGDKHAGIVFFPAGTYRITRPVLLWKGMHLLGHPDHQATLLLSAETPGYANADAPCPMLQLTCGTDQDVDDHTHYPRGHGSLNWVFHTALRHLDFVVEEGNPGAVVTWWWSDHDCSIEHAHLQLHSGKAAVWMPEDSGRVHLYRCRFDGGDYGFYAGEYSQNSVIACEFHGQRCYSIAVQHSRPATVIKDCSFAESRACILTDTTGGVIILDSDFTAPTDGTAIECPDGALLVSNARFTQCRWAIQNHVAGALQGEMTVPGYLIGTVAQGETTAAFAGPLPAALAVPDADYRLADLYADEDSPGNVCRYGAVGDGVQDDSAAMQRAIDAQEIVYLPMGTYRLEQTVRLHRTTKLIGAHRSEVKLLGADGQTALETPNDADAEVLIKEVQIHCGAANGIGLDWRCGGRSVLFMVNTWTEPGGYTAFLARENAGGTYLFAW